MSNDFDNTTDLAEFDSETAIEEAGAFDHNAFNGGQNDFVIETESPRRALGSGPVLIALVVVLAAGALWSMRTLAIAMATTSMDQGLEGVIDEAIKRFAPGAVDETDGRVLAALEQDESSTLVEDRTEKQVPLEDVQKNPFKSFIEPKQGESATATTTTPGDTGPSLAELQAKRIDDFEIAAAKLRVLIILGGADPVANVSGRMVRVGDKIHDDKYAVEFTVAEIEAGLVILEAKDAKLELVHQVLLRLRQDG